MPIIFDAYFHKDSWSIYSCYLRWSTLVKTCSDLFVSYRSLNVLQVKFFQHIGVVRRPVWRMAFPPSPGRRLRLRLLLLLVLEEGKNSQSGRLSNTNARPGTIQWESFRCDSDFLPPSERREVNQWMDYQSCCCCRRCASTFFDILIFRTF